MIPDTCPLHFLYWDVLCFNTFTLKCVLRFFLPPPEGVAHMCIASLCKWYLHAHVPASPSWHVYLHTLTLGYILGLCPCLSLPLMKAAHMCSLDLCIGCSHEHVAHISFLWTCTFLFLCWVYTGVLSLFGEVCVLSWTHYSLFFTPSSSWEFLNKTVLTSLFIVCFLLKFFSAK